MPTLNYQVQLDTSNIQSQAAEISQAVSSGLNVTGRLGGMGISAGFAAAPNTVIRDLGFVSQMLPIGNIMNFMASPRSEVSQMSTFGLMSAGLGMPFPPPPQNMFAQEFPGRVRAEFGERFAMGMTAGVTEALATLPAFLPGMGLISGLALTLPLSIAAGAGLERLQTRTDAQRVLQNRGIDQYQARGMVGFAESLRGPLFGAGESLQQLAFAAEAGVIGPDQTGQEMRREFQQFQQNINRFTKQLKLANEDAQATLAGLGGLGIGQGAISDLGLQIAGTTMNIGGRRQALQLAAGGGQAAMQMGISGGVGAQIGVNAASITNYMLQEDMLSRNQLAMVGGREGLGNLLMQQQLQASQMPIMRSMGLALIDPVTGTLDPTRMAQLRGGNLSLRDLSTMASNALATPSGRELAQGMQINPGAFARELSSALGPAFLQAVREMQTRQPGMSAEMAAQAIGQMGMFGQMSPMQAQAFMQAALAAPAAEALTERKAREAGARETVDIAMRETGLWRRKISKPAEEIWEAVTSTAAGAAEGTIRGFKITGRFIAEGWGGSYAEIVENIQKSNLTPQQKADAIEEARRQDMPAPLRTFAPQPQGKEEQRMEILRNITAQIDVEKAGFLVDPDIKNLTSSLSWGFNKVTGGKTLSMLTGPEFSEKVEPLITKRIRERQRALENISGLGREYLIEKEIGGEESEGERALSTVKISEMPQAILRQTIAGIDLSDPEQKRLLLTAMQRRGRLSTVTDEEMNTVIQSARETRQVPLEEMNRLRNIFGWSANKNINTLPKEKVTDILNNLRLAYGEEGLVLDPAGAGPILARAKQLGISTDISFDARSEMRNLTRKTLQEKMSGVTGGGSSAGPAQFADAVFINTHIHSAPNPGQETTLAGDGNK